MPTPRAGSNNQDSTILVRVKDEHHAQKSDGDGLVLDSGVGRHPQRVVVADKSGQCPDPQKPRQGTALRNGFLDLAAMPFCRWIEGDGCDKDGARNHGRFYCWCHESSQSLGFKKAWRTGDGDGATPGTVQA